jgi:hypothetical protein
MPGTKNGGKINTHAWMLSYADMATILLAMFIVLSTLGKDQTGVSLQRATGSFANALRSYGLPGLFSSSPNPMPLAGPMPRYLYAPSDSSLDRSNPVDPRPKRVIDGDEENLQRFLEEIQRQFSCVRRPRPAGQVIIDLYQPLQKSPPYLMPRHNQALLQIAPLLQRSNYRLDLVVWAATPSPTAWTRAINQAVLAAEEFAAGAGLDEEARGRLMPLGQPWRYRDVRRPVMSLVLTRQE